LRFFVVNTPGRGLRFFKVEGVKGGAFFLIFLFLKKRLKPTLLLLKGACSHCSLALNEFFPEVLNQNKNGFNFNQAKHRNLVNSVCWGRFVFWGFCGRFVFACVFVFRVCVVLCVFFYPGQGGEKVKKTKVDVYKLFGFWAGDCVRAKSSGRLI